ncbi:MAG: mechanosensitive ion channel [Planctomycetes bacterium]|nr:mechanosensitive ion channel [Planctomycetota bacterium]
MSVRAADGLRKRASQESNTVGDVVAALDRWALEIGSLQITLWDTLVFVGVLIGIFFAAWLLSRTARRLLRRLTGFDETQRLLAEKLVTIAVWAVAFFVGIDVLGIDLTALAVFSGAFGLAIGFGLQKTFGNLIAGIILLMDRSIKPGDVIAIADAAGNSTFGQIRKIGIRAVSLTTRDQKEYLIPNENLMVNQVENWSYSSKNVRVQVPVGIGYGCDIVAVEKLMLEAARSATRVLTTPPPVVWLDSFGESAIQFKIHCWINDPEEGVGNVRSDVLKRLWALFREHKIDVPFPQRDINLKDSAQLRALVEAIARHPGPNETEA